jgi:hypothetical protein
VEASAGKATTERQNITTPIERQNITTPLGLGHDLEPIKTGPGLLKILGGERAKTGNKGFTKTSPGSRRLPTDGAYPVHSFLQSFSFPLQMISFFSM